MNQIGLNSQLAIGLGSQRSSLNSKYFSVKYPDSFIWFHCVQYALHASDAGFVAAVRTKPELTLLERPVAWELNVQWDRNIFFELFLRDLDEKITSAGCERHTKGNSELNKLILPDSIFTLWRFTRKTKTQLTLDNFSLSSQQLVPNYFLYPSLREILAQFWPNKFKHSSATDRHY